MRSALREDLLGFSLLAALAAFLIATNLLMF